MSVARCREINARLRAAGFVVHEFPGCWSRGNGQNPAYEGGIVHHTGSAFGYAFPDTGIGRLLAYGRSDLSGPLTNWATNEDGSFTFIAAFPANHAGASGGKSMGPLPVTTLFNRRVMGNEIVYPGSVPMRPAQYRSAVAWSRIITDVCGYGDIQRARAHAETSITGKWDPGYASGRTVDMAGFRNDARLVTFRLPPPPTPLIPEEIIAMQDGSLFYAKGDKAPNVYLVRVQFEADPPVVRREVGPAEFEIVTQSGGEKLTTMSQALFDAIPKIEGSR